MQAEDDLQALAERAVAAIAAPPERGALASMVVAALLRSDPARGLPRLDALPPPYRKLALLRAAQGGAPSPALAARAQAELATWEALGDDEAALGLWAGLDLDALARPARAAARARCLPARQAHARLGRPSRA
ncbi:MAG: hypothetical protein U1F43_05255 [Myxococcota bacterium]